MKQLVVLAALAAFVFAILVYSPAQAGPQERVMICHVNPDGDVDDAGVLIPPMVIEVAAPSVDAHMAHGDCLALEEAVVGDVCSCGL